MFTTKNNKLCATFTFSDFCEAWSFMTHVAFAAERADHHPNWSNIYNTVVVELCTHDAGNIVTEKDHALAQQIEIIYAKFIHI